MNDTPDEPLVATGGILESKLRKPPEPPDRWLPVMVSIPVAAIVAAVVSLLVT